MAYKDQVLEYVGKLQSGWGSYIPRDFPMSMFNSNMPDETLYLAARQLRKEVEYNRMNAKQAYKMEHAEPAHSAMSGHVYLMPYKFDDGTIIYYDKHTNQKVASLYPEKGGLFTYYGPREFITMLGGRGELGQMIKMMEDGDLFHDTPRK